MGRATWLGKTSLILWDNCAIGEKPVVFYIGAEIIPVQKRALSNRAGE